MLGTYLLNLCTAEWNGPGDLIVLLRCLHNDGRVVIIVKNLTENINNKTETSHRWDVGMPSFKRNINSYLGSPEVRAVFVLKALNLEWLLP